MATMEKSSGCFRPHVWGSFFILPGSPSDVSSTLTVFSSPCLGIFFYTTFPLVYGQYSLCFRPHVWGSFFIYMSRMHLYDILEMFSSPCLGIFFYLDGAKQFPTASGNMFSSPCLGIFFYEIDALNAKLDAFVFVPMFGDLFLLHEFQSLHRG